MRILYNGNSTAPMNDISVTSGDADGWAFAPVSHLENAPARPAEQSARRPAERQAGASAKSAKPAKA